VRREVMIGGRKERRKEGTNRKRGEQSQVSKPPPITVAPSPVPTGPTHNPRPLQATIAKKLTIHNVSSIHLLDRSSSHHHWCLQHQHHPTMYLDDAGTKVHGKGHT
jgi:hypothetical protein